MKHIDELINNYPELNIIKKNIEHSFNILKSTYKKGNKVLLCGNGGSSADCSHIQGELMKSFCKSRKISSIISNNIKKVDSSFYKSFSKYLEMGLPTINISNFDSLNTAILNDTKSDIVYANSVLNLGKKGDTLIAISTSGNSINVVNAAIVAKALGMNIIALTGKDGGKIKKFATESIIVPKKDTYRIQEFHLPIYHALCLELEDCFF